jgi:TetR/AcrR family transcriptional regulator, transcriptional repressor for nem operon
MRYEKGRRDTTRQHILDVASRRFREDGVAAAGLAGIMKDAGLTNGAFYNHFESKDDLVRETLNCALDHRLERVSQATESGAGVEPMLRDYLSTRHRDNPSTGCPTAALLGEIARQPRKTRTAFTEKASRLIQLMEDHLPGELEIRRRNASAIYAMMIGTLQLSRAFTDKKLSDQILENGIQAALALVQSGTGRNADAGSMSMFGSGKAAES